MSLRNLFNLSFYVQRVLSRVIGAAGHAIAASALLLSALFGSSLASAYDVEENSVGNTVYVLLENLNVGAVYHSISIVDTPPSFVSSVSVSIVPETIPGLRHRLAAVEFDVAAGASLGASGDLVLSVQGLVAGRVASVDVPVPLTVVSSAAPAQGYVGTTIPAADPNGIDTDGDGVVDSLETAYGSNPQDAGSLPGDFMAVVANVPVMLAPLSAIFAVVLIVIARKRLALSRGLHRLGGSERYSDGVKSASPEGLARFGSASLFALSGLLLIVALMLVVVAHANAGSAVRIQLVAALPEVSSVEANITETQTISATASSTGAAGGAAQAADGSLSTRWESLFNIDPSWLTIDLGASYDIDTVIIHWEAANAGVYEIQGSNDNSTWTVLSLQTGGTFGDRTDTVSVAGNYRYVRMYGISRSPTNVYGYSIWEMEVYGSVALVNDSDNDGVDDSVDQCPATPADTVVEADGCEPGTIGGYDAPTSYPGYTLAWSDEFNGSALNLNDWTHEIGTGCPSLCGWGNNELQYYREQNTSVANGVLTIEAKQETFAGQAYTSSRIKTQGKQFFQYGRIDIRAVLPSGKGLWPALWMLGESISNVGWPASGEIDIMELRGDEPNKYLGTAHWSNGGNYALYGSECAAPGCTDNSPVLSSGTFADEFHVFSIVWDSSAIRWYLDDASQPFHVINISGAELSEFRDEFFFLFNIAVGGNFLDNPDGSASFPQKMIVDYIRVYQ